MMQVRWQLGEYLKTHGLTAYKLAQVLPDVRQPTVYRLASEQTPQSVNLNLLGRILDGLSTLTGQRVEIGEVLQVVEVKPTQVEKPAFDTEKLYQPFARRTGFGPLSNGAIIDSAALVAGLRGD